MSGLWICFELFITVIEELIVFRFMCRFLKHDFSSAKGKAIYIFGSLISAIIVSVLNSFTTYESWLGIVYIICWLIFVLIFQKGSVLHKVLSVLIAVTVAFAASTLVANSVSFLANSEVDDIYSNAGINRFLTMVLVQIVLVYAYGVILRIFDKTLLLLKKKEWLLIISIFLMSFFSLTMIHMVAYNTNFEVHSIEILLAEIGIVSINPICLYMTFELSNSNRMTEEMKLSEQQKEYSIQYAQTVRKQYEEIRNMRHDMKQHYTVIYRLQKEKKYELSSEYIEQCLDKIKNVELLMDVGNNFVNALLNSKLSVAKSMGIEVLCSS